MMMGETEAIAALGLCLATPAVAAVIAGLVIVRKLLK